MNDQMFTDKIENLEPEAFVQHFLTRTTVSYPIIPNLTEAELAIAQNTLYNEFCFCGEAYILPAGFSWKVNPSQDKEWQIAHHKFSYALYLAKAYRQFGQVHYLQKWVELLESWLNEMESGFAMGSDAQVEARRLERWVNSLMVLQSCGDRIPHWQEHHRLITPPFLRRLLTRIVTETLYICNHLTPSRNHRTLQLSTIFLVGVLFPEFRLHSYFLEFGKAQLTENLLAEILPDGVHIELSTHYHQLSLKSALEFVELAHTNQVSLDPTLLGRLEKGLEFYAFMQLPNGEIPLINDADQSDFRYLLSIGSRLFQNDTLLWAATLGKDGTPPSQCSRHFENSGYFVLSDGWGYDPISYHNRQHIFYDCAGLGEGTHAHFDLFNFCYYVNGRPVIVDPGRYTYDAKPDADGINWRKEFKSTAYHNTVEIDGKDQTRYIPKEKPGKFKFGPAVHILEPNFYLGTHSDWVCARAESAEYAPVHQRFFLYMHRQYLFILDRVQMNDSELHTCRLRFHLSPELSDRTQLKMTETAIVALTPDLAIHTYRNVKLTAAIESGWVSSKYGIKHAAPVVTFTQTRSNSLFFCSVIAPTLSQQNRLKISSLNLLNILSDEVLLFQVEGTLEGQIFRDYFCCSKEFELAGSTQPKPKFQENILAFRQNEQGTVLYQVGLNLGNTHLEKKMNSSNQKTLYRNMSAVDLSRWAQLN